MNPPPTPPVVEEKKQPTSERKEKAVKPVNKTKVFFYYNLLT